MKNATKKIELKKIDREELESVVGGSLITSPLANTLIPQLNVMDIKVIRPPFAGDMPGSW